MRSGTLAIEDILAQVADTRGERDSEELAVLSCKLGDYVYIRLLELLKEKMKNRHEEQRELKEKYLKKVKEETPDDRYEISKAERMIKVVENTKDIDYSDSLKRQLDYFADDLGECREVFCWSTFEFRNALSKRRKLKKEGFKFPELVSFEGLPFTIFDSHKHSYFLIKDYLEKTDEPVVIARFDAHGDTHPEYEEDLNRTNYVSQILFDDGLSSKIKEVITVAGKLPDPNPIEHLPRDKEKEAQFGSIKCESYKLNGVNHSVLKIFDLPEITAPVLLDIDMDGHEQVQSTAHTGGYFFARRYSRYRDEQDNQESIYIHPAVAAKILRERIRNPVEIYAATERPWRNMLFHYRIEHDFLQALLE